MNIKVLLNLHSQKTTAQLLRSVLQFPCVLLSLYSVILGLKLFKIQASPFPTRHKQYQIVSREGDNFRGRDRSRRG